MRSIVFEKSYRFLGTTKYRVLANKYAVILSPNVL